MRRTLLGLTVMTLMVTACGQPQAQPATSPATSPSAPAPLLFAVLQANTVAIAGLDGKVVAQSAFTPMPVPSIGCMGAIDPPSAHVAAGKVFYADGSGVVRSLAIDGTVTTVATFPLTSTLQMLSFAVSPDGGRILGTVFTIPKNAFGCAGSSSTSTFTFDAYEATSSTSSRLVYHDTWSGSRSVMALTGWDAVGPVGTYPTVWASQGGGPSSTLGVIVRIDASTVRPLAPFADPSSCLVWQSVESGAFVCTPDAVETGAGVDSPVSVRRADGSEIWHFTVTSMNAANSPLLAPDELHVMVCCADVSGPAFAELMVGQDGSKTTLANGFFAEGWLDAQTVIGESHPDPLQQPPFSLGYVRSADPGTFTSMGFSGQFVGTVRD
jgi:hypothetical protein